MKRHLEVVGAVVVQDGKVLAAKRGESKYPYVAHKYEFVGGKIEQGETRESALVREVKEELKADIRVLSPFLEMRHEYPDFFITLYTFFVRISLRFYLYGARIFAFSLRAGA